MAESIGFPTCKHIKTDGVKCESPSMSGRHFCYYHSLYRQRNKPNKKTPKTMHAPMVDAEDHWHRVEVMDPFAKRYTLGLLDDGPSLQVAISTVVNALADNRIDIGRASTLLYGLQLASTNLRTFHPVDPEAGTTAEPSATDPAPGTPTTPAGGEPAPAPAPGPSIPGTYTQVPVREELSVDLFRQRQSNE